MRAAGAVNLHGGVWVLPHRPEQEAVARSVFTEIRAAGGDLILIAGDTLAGLDAETVRERFQAERDQEYAEFCERCHEFMAEVDRETAKRKFTFAELEEIEDDLGKLQAWLGKIQRRDFFGATRARQAVEEIAACEQACAAFTGRVYAEQGVNVADGEIYPPGEPG